MLEGMQGVVVDEDANGPLRRQQMRCMPDLPRQPLQPGRHSAGGSCCVG